MSTKGTKLSEQEIRQAREQFNKYDVNHDGTIDFSELKSLLETTLKTKLSDKLLEKYVSAEMDTTDKNKDKVIQFDEFLKLYERLYHSHEIPIGVKEMQKRSFVQKPDSNAPKVVKKEKAVLSEEQVKEARAKFDHYDKDKSGTIDKDEMKKIIEETVLQHSKSQMILNRVTQSFLNDADKSGNGEITFDQFLTIYSRLFEHH